MNIKEYIESGLLEAFALGALTAAEQAEVLSNAARYPEIAQELAAIEATMQGLAESTAEAPPAFLQNQIWNAIAQDQQKNNTATSADKPTVVALPVRATQTRWQYAAVWIALVGSLLVNFVLWFQKSNSLQQQVAVQHQLDTITQQQKQLALVIENYHKEKEMMADPAMQTIIMQTLKPGHPMAATVYWNKEKGAAYLAVQKLPMPPKGMQYQMWVIQSGKPVSMGVIDNSLVSNAVVEKLPMQVMDGQAFAISLEKEGGSPTPTAENIYVLGKVAS